MAEQENPTQLLTVLSNRKADWASTTWEDKYTSALEIRSRVLSAAATWGVAAATVRGIPKEAAASQELRGMVVPLANYLDGLLATLDLLRKGGEVPVPPADKEGDAYVVQAYPWGFVQRWLSLLGWASSTEVTLQPGVEPTRGPAGSSPALALVHGAGHSPVEALLGVLHLAFAEDCVVGLALPPYQRPLQLAVEYIMDPLGREGYFASVVVPVEDMAKLLVFPGLDRLHLVGHTPDTVRALAGLAPAGLPFSAAGGNAGPKGVVGGTASSGPPTAPFPGTVTGDISGATPWIVVPGRWSQAALQHQSQVLVEALAYAGSAAPLSPRVVLLSAAWDQGDEFIRLVKEELDVYKRPALLDPGAPARHEALLKEYPTAWVSSARARSDLPEGTEPCPPWAVLELGPWASATRDHLPFGHTDCRVGWLAIGRLPVEPGDEHAMLRGFLDEAVDVCTRTLRGNVAATIMVNKAAHREHRADIEAAIMRLEYGMVCVNCPPRLAALSAQLPRGCHAGRPDPALFRVGVQASQRPEPSDLLPGVLTRLGMAGNSLMLHNPAKGVVRLPFESYLHPLPMEYQVMTLRTARTMAVGILDGARGFARAMRDTSADEARHAAGAAIEPAVDAAHASVGHRTTT